MPVTRSLSFPVVKKSKKVTTKSTPVKRKRPQKKTDIDDASSDTSCTEKKMPKLNKNVDNSSKIEDELQSIKDVFEDSSVEKFAERKEQIETLHKYLDKCVENNESVSLYVCGPSGTGKTTTLEFLQAQTDIQENFTIVYIDCLSYRFNTANVYKEIIEKLGGNVKATKTQKDSVDKVLKAMSCQKKPILLILDEVDTLKTKNQAVLYSLFELPSRLHDGKLALITVGNILTFVDRFLPRLRGVYFKKPVTLEFPAYTDRDIVNIISKRLSKINLKRITVEPHAIQLLGRKAASLSGNAKDALQLAKEVLETCVTKNAKDGICTVQPIHVHSVMNDIFEEVEKLSHLDHLPLHQKLIICAVLLLIQNSKFDRTKLNIYTIENKYRKICNEKKLETCPDDEFIHLISLIELTGIFSVGGKKIDRSSKVNMNWDEDAIRNAFSDKTLFGGILCS